VVGRVGGVAGNRSRGLRSPAWRVPVFASRVIHRHTELIGFPMPGFGCGVSAFEGLAGCGVLLCFLKPWDAVSEMEETLDVT